MTRALAVATLLLCPAALAAQYAPLRTVKNGVLISPADPAVSLVIAPALRYAGGQTIDIFKVAGAEQHFFVEADKDRSVTRFCWIQFEHYYPTNSDVYDYTGIEQTPIKLGRLEFMGDLGVIGGYFVKDNRPGSDSQAALDFLRRQGYKLEGTFARLRMFHLPDGSKRKELMIIYGERVPDGATSGQMTAPIRSRAQAAIKTR